MDTTKENQMRIRLTVLALTVMLMTLIPAAGAFAHVHGITPLPTLESACGVTNGDDTGANRAQSDVIDGLIPRDVGNADLGGGDGGSAAPVGCAD